MARGREMVTVSVGLVRVRMRSDSYVWVRSFMSKSYTRKNVVVKAEVTTARRARGYPRTNPARRVAENRNASIDSLAAEFRGALL
jgi:hypothetical protein